MACVEKVTVVESCIVTPCEETPRHGLWLSPLDLMMVNRGHTPNVYFYRSASGSGLEDGFFDVARLKAAMAKALVAFYPLAGRLGVDADGRAQIDCAGQGAHFVVARSDLTVDDFSNCQPSPELKRLFVPSVVEDSPCVMLAIQVTFFKCGGVALGTALHHVAIDAMSAVHFFQTWSAFSRAGTDDSAAATALLELPCHDRTLLRARSPPRVVHPDAVAVFCPLKNNLNISEPSPPIGPVVNEIFVITKDQVAALKHACSGASTFCAVSAHVWRCICAARRLEPDATTRLTFPANFRRILRPPLPERYFGNGIILVSASGKVRDIVFSEDELTLASVAERIKDAIRRLDDELVRSAIDYLEMNEAPPARSMPETEVTVVSWLGMPVYDADFGWGKPVKLTRAVQQRAGLIYLADDGQEDGGIRVLMSIEAAVLKDFRSLLYAKF